jgi:predicted Zn-dependent peptidase
VGTREENLSSCLEIASAEIADIAANGPTDAELERAKENLKGRIMLSMESTSNRMTRLGRSVITDTEILSLPRIIAEIEGVEPEAISALAGVLLAQERLSAAGIGPSEKQFSTAVERVSPGLVERLAA